MSESNPRKYAHQLYVNSTSCLTAVNMPRSQRLTISEHRATLPRLDLWVTTSIIRWLETTTHGNRHLSWTGWFTSKVLCNAEYIYLLQEVALMKGLLICLYNYDEPLSSISLIHHELQNIDTGFEQCLFPDGEDKQHCAITGVGTRRQ